MIIKLKAPTLYAVQILVIMRDEGKKSMTSDYLAEKVGVTPSYLMWIMARMKETGLIRSIQGRYGGFFLGRNPQDISLYDVIMGIEGEQGEEYGQEYMVVSQLAPGLKNALNDLSQKAEISLKSVCLPNF